MMSEKGYTLVETVVAAAAIGLLVMATASLAGYMSAEKSKLRQRSLLQRSARAFIHQVSMDEKNIPAYPQPAQWGQLGYDPYLDERITRQVCYSSDGIPVADLQDPLCFFKIRYFQIVVTDQKYPANQDIAALPLTRLYFQVSFRENATDRVYYFSRLQSGFLQQ